MNIFDNFVQYIKFYPVAAGFIIAALVILPIIIAFLAKRGFSVPLTRYGLPQVAVFPVIIAAIMAGIFLAFRPGLWLVIPEAALFLTLIWALSFFRNPKRKIINDESVLLSPADGTVTDISLLDSDDLGKALRIGIFLSIFSVHLNRAPCSVKVNRISYKKGKFKDARSPESTKVNESNDLLLTRTYEPFDRIIVRQVSGAIARHIVCGAKENDELSQGEIFGMIKFGSRTELYIPASDEKKYKVTVKIGDAVRAGLTPLVRYV